MSSHLVAPPPRMGRTLRALRAAGPALRRRISPPRMDLLPPTLTVRYSDRPGPHPPWVDIYRPEGVSQAPTALIVHGGGFVGGARDMSSVAVLATDLVRSGVVVASIDYQLVRPWRGHLHQQEQDVREALRWWQHNAGQHGGDPDRTALVGLSAGGGLSVLAADEGGFDRFVGIYGAYDLSLLPAPWVVSSLLVRDPRRQVHVERSPLQRGGFQQPALLIHGTSDPLAPAWHSVRLLHHRQALALPTQVLWIEGAEHGFLQDGAHVAPSVQTLQAVRRFITEPHPLTPES